MEEKTAKYFDTPGVENTTHCLNIVKSEVNDNGYRYLIVATTTGETGAIFAEAFKDTEVNLVVVTYADEKGENAIPEGNRSKILEGGATLFNSPSIAPLVDKTFAGDCPDGSPSTSCGVPVPTTYTPAPLAAVLSVTVTLVRPAALLRSIPPPAVSVGVPG